MTARRDVLVRARALTGFAELIDELGGNVTALLARSGIPASVLQEPESTLSLKRLVNVLESAATTLATPDFGLRLARRQDISVLGAVALIAQYAASVGDAVRSVSRHFPYHSPGIRFVLTDDADARRVQLHYQIDLDSRIPVRQTVELALAVAQSFLKIVTGASAASWRIDFVHRAGLSAARYRKAFGCEVRFEQEANRLVFPARLLQVAIDPGSTGLREAAERYVSSLIRRYPLDIGQQVEALIERQLATAGCGIERIAAQLGMHKRTLQRRLEEQGLHFEHILDRLRRERANQLLPHGAIPLTEVCELLGYSEQSSFNRACRRWYGATPLRFRNQLRSGSSQ